MGSFAEELERLARLRANGDITDAEYEALKAHVLSGLPTEADKKSSPKKAPKKKPAKKATTKKKAAPIKSDQSVEESEQGSDEEVTPGPKESAEFPQGFTPVKSSNQNPSPSEVTQTIDFDRLLMMMTRAASATEVKTALQEYSDSLMGGMKFSEEEKQQLDELREVLLKVHAANRAKSRAELEENLKRHDAARESANALSNPVDEAISFKEDGTPHLDLNKIPTGIEPPLPPEQQQIANEITEKAIASSDDPEHARFLAEMPVEHQNALIEAFEKHVLGQPKQPQVSEQALKARQEGLKARAEELRQKNRELVYKQTNSFFRLRQFLQMPLKEVVEQVCLEKPFFDLTMGYEPGSYSARTNNAILRA